MFEFDLADRDGGISYNGTAVLVVRAAMIVANISMYHEELTDDPMTDLWS